MSARNLESRQPPLGLGANAGASPLRIVLVSSEPRYRVGIEVALRGTSSLLLLTRTCIGDAIVLAQARLADMAVIDADGCRDAIAMAQALALTCPHIPIVAVSEAATADNVRMALEAGIRGYILKGVEAGEFVRILTSIAQGALYLPPELGAGLLRQNMRLNGATRANRRPYGLTAREEEILSCVARALTNKEVARELQISEKTVKHYMTVIMEKLQVRNRVEAVQKVNACPWIVAS
jgi:two-component system, NarL family, nitrate/nitrite response regulator NarL